MRAKKLSDFWFRRLPLRGSQHEFNEQFVRRIDRHPVDLQEQQRCFQSNSFIGIDEGVVLHDMKQVSSGHLEKISVQVLPAEHCLRLSQRGFEQTHVTYPFPTAVRRNLLRMRFKNVVQAEKYRWLVLLRQLLESLGVLGIDLLPRGADASLLSGFRSRADRHRTTVGGDFQRAFRTDFEQVEDGAINDKGPTIAMLDEILDHIRSPMLKHQWYTIVVPFRPSVKANTTRPPIVTLVREKVRNVGPRRGRRAGLASEATNEKTPRRGGHRREAVVCGALGRKRVAGLPVGGELPALGLLEPRVLPLRADLPQDGAVERRVGRLVYARLGVSMRDRGCLSLFGDSPEHHRLLAEHLTAEYRVKTEGRGRTVDEWKQRPERGDNHWFDGLVGCAVAGSIQGAVLEGTGGSVTTVNRQRVSFAEMQRRKRA